jgi:hypothetical protein
MGPLETIASWLLKAYKESPRFMVVLCVLSAALLFIPACALAWFSLDNFAVANRSWISLVFFFSLLVVISYPVTSLWSWMIFEIRGWWSTREGLKRLHALDDKEKEILGLYISCNVRTQYFQLDNGTVADLRLRGILLCPMRIVPMHRAPMVLADWAWNYLREHPDLLK